MKDNTHLGLEINRFYQAYSAEAKRNNALLAKYPDNSRYQETDRNYETIIASFEYLEKYITAQNTRIALLEIENKMLADDYARQLEKDILNDIDFTTNNGKNTKP